MKNIKTITRTIMLLFIFFLGVGIESAFCQTSEDNFTYTQSDVEYPGGMEALRAYVNKNLTYPEKARKAKIQGRVSIEFVIEKDGRVTNIKVAYGSKKLGYGLEEEALRVIKGNPAIWKPAKQNGKPLRLRKAFSIIFELPKEKIKTK